MDVGVSDVSFLTRTNKRDLIIQFTICIHLVPSLMKGSKGWLSGFTVSPANHKVQQSEQERCKASRSVGECGRVMCGMSRSEGGGAL